MADAGRAIIANRQDSVATALVPLARGERVAGVELIEDIGAGHKFALVSHALDDAVFKLGQPIGVASQIIAPGAHVHTHNLAFASHVPQHAASYQWTAPHAPQRVFEGILRDDGRVGTRNYIGILASVNCSATVARRIAAHFTAERLAPFPNVDGVLAFTHLSGCGMARNGAAFANLQATITGYARHPNFAAALLVGLGCEVNQIDDLAKCAGGAGRIATLNIQDIGGTAAAIEAGIAVVEKMLAAANVAARTPVPASALTIGLQCGASDGYSALTANPVLGALSDLVVAAGGKVILSETPEIYGAETILLRRANTPTVADDLRRRISWWEDYAAREGGLDNNPSPGNKAGGITTILEKSLGAIAKAGGSPLQAVVDYARPVNAAGLTFMDTPGYDPCSATGQIAGGANIILFTTGRGSTFGSKPAPTYKLASNPGVMNSMAEDMDFDCSGVLAGQSLESIAQSLFDAVLDFAGGKKSRSELADMGDYEFVPWLPGSVF